MRKCVTLLAGMIFFLLSCQNQQQQTDFSVKDINAVISKMTDIMVHDITNPPLAARFFSYSLLSGYEILSAHDSSLPSMSGRLNRYPELNHPDTLPSYHPQLAALLAMMRTSEKMQPSGSEMVQYEKAFLDSCRNAGMNETMIAGSLSYAAHISNQVLAYAKEDAYNKISNYPRYTPQKAAGNWYPTPPAFIAAVEPYFNKVRPFTLDSASQFKPLPPVPYSTEKNSAFYNLLNAVYLESKNADEEHMAIAAFWDCNPFMVNDKGHLQYAFKKISPGAHWLGISGIACVQAGKGFNESLQILSTVSVGLMDAFMSCWDEKYRSHRIRPETAIRRLIDPSWEPLLQTPPFPEYLSGHSTISTCSAEILTRFFGENFAYTDSVEVPYGLPARKFQSFKQAAAEAGVSRFYGGIHYMDAIDNGNIQGRLVGEWVYNKLVSQNNKNMQASAGKK